MQFVNPELMLNLDNEDADFDEDLNKVYAFIQFMRPGRQTYVTCMPETEKSDGMTYFTHRAIINNREEEIPLFVKADKTHKTVRKFNKDTSVFKDWMIDTRDDALNCIEHDLLLWHCNKFVKNPDQMEAL